jgi:hypothetical protein
MEQTIKSVKINAKSRLKIFLEGDVMYGEDTIFEKTTRQSFEEPSQSLLDSFKLLLPHYLIHTKHKQDFTAEYIKSGKAIKDDKLKNFAVNGFTLSGEGEEEKVILHGLVFEDDKGMPISTLKIALYNNDAYAYSGNLVEDLQNLLQELELFLDGNFKKDPQGTLYFNLGEVEEESF